MIYQWKLYKGPPPPGSLACHELICELLQQPFGLAKTISHANQYPWYGTLPAKGAQKFLWLLCETYLLHLLVWLIKCLLLILIFGVMCKETSPHSLVSAGSCSAPPHLWYFVRGPGNLNRCLVFCKPDMPTAAVLQQAPWLLKVQRPSFSKSGDPSDLIYQISKTICLSRKFKIVLKVNVMTSKDNVRKSCENNVQTNSGWPQTSPTCPCNSWHPPDPNKPCTGRRQLCAACILNILHKLL